jgi:predicted dienelactone hydrolase
MRNLTAICLIICVGLSACQPATETLEQSSVGMMRRQFVDQNRQNWANTGPRPMSTMIWYPTGRKMDATRFDVPVDQPVFSGGLQIIGAKPNTAERKVPLVLLSHGTGGSAFQMMWLGRRLAEAGYIAAAIDHHGNSAAEAAFDPRGFQLITERPLDMSRVLDQLLEDEVFGPLIDPDHIAVAGFSLGGYTVITLAGGQIDFSQMKRFCTSEEADKTCEPQDEFPEAGRKMEELSKTDPRIANFEANHMASFADPRIGYVAAMAPALGMAFTKESLSNIILPIHIFAGAGDQIAPPASNAEVIAHDIPNAKLEIIPGEAGHYAFLNTCTDHGKKYVPICMDEAGVERSLIHQQTAAAIVSDLQIVFAK